MVERGQMTASRGEGLWPQDPRLDWQPGAPVPSRVEDYPENCSSTCSTKMMWMTRTEGESQHLETKIIVVTKDQASEKACKPVRPCVRTPHGCWSLPSRRPTGEPWPKTSSTHGEPANMAGWALEMKRITYVMQRPTQIHAGSPRPAV